MFRSLKSRFIKPGKEGQKRSQKPGQTLSRSRTSSYGSTGSETSGYSSTGSQGSSKFSTKSRTPSYDSAQSQPAASLLNLLVNSLCSGHLVQYAAHPWLTDIEAHEADLARLEFHRGCCEHVGDYSTEKAVDVYTRYAQNTTRPFCPEVVLIDHLVSVDSAHPAQPPSPALTVHKSFGPARSTDQMSTQHIRVTLLQLGSRWRREFRKKTMFHPGVLQHREKRMIEMQNMGLLLAVATVAAKDRQTLVRDIIVAYRESTEFVRDSSRWEGLVECGDHGSSFETSGIMFEELLLILQEEPTINWEESDRSRVGSSSFYKLMYFSWVLFGDFQFGRRGFDHLSEQMAKARASDGFINFISAQAAGDGIQGDLCKSFYADLVLN